MPSAGPMATMRLVAVSAIVTRRRTATCWTSSGLWDVGRLAALDECLQVTTSLHLVVEHIGVAQMDWVGGLADLVDVARRNANSSGLLLELLEEVPLVLIGNDDAWHLIHVQLERNDLQVFRHSGERVTDAFERRRWLDSTQWNSSGCRADRRSMPMTNTPSERATRTEYATRCPRI